ncbi:endonuclease/exonuclease/phosphatase family protein [Patescibacteria group bacterium]|nr:endonuclease/exonuclease/phosphatase family protein [Patescibacteria group bacterium]
MKIKILTINICRYYEWEKRKKKIISFLKKENADIIFLQEVAYDERLKDKWENQVEEINKKVKYPSSKFGKLMEMNKWHNKPVDWVIFYGFGILSKYPIKCSEVIILPPVEKNKKSGFMHIVIETPKGNINLINVHFENTNKGSKEHLKQTLNWCKEKKIKSIIAGDFNMKIVRDLKEIAEKDYEISYSIKPYKSFMPNDFSHDKVPVTLDYIIIDKEKFKFISVECTNNHISDHNPVVAEIKIKE